MSAPSVDLAAAPGELGHEFGISRAAPTSARLKDLDVIRGLALLGVLVMNLVHGFRKVHSYARGVAPNEPLSHVDHIVENMLYAGVEDKAMTLFSMLFGMGLAIFLERAEEKGKGKGKLLLCKRLAILLAFGLAHAMLVWEGDILTPYAVAGFLAIVVIHRSRWLLLALGLLLPAVFPLIAWRYPWLLPQGGPAAVAHYERALAVYGHGSYTDVVAFRASDVVGVRAHFLLVRGLAQILGNVLLGIFVWRTGILRQVERYRTMLVWVAVAGIAVGGGFAAYRILLPVGRTSGSPGSPLLRLGWNMTLALYAAGYAAAVLVLRQSDRWRTLLGRFAPVGRMAFTNYLAQSVIFTTVFYGYGCGLLGKVGILEVVVMGTAVYAAQVVASTFWLRQFQFGPCEWLWRSLTYGSPQAFRARPLPGDEP